MRNVKFFSIKDLFKTKFETVSKYNSHTKETIKYYNVECAFDIETTSTYVNGDKVAFMYEWTFGIKNEKLIYFGRTWNELLEFLKKLKEYLKLNADNRILVVYVHNLGYEFQFMRKYFNWVSVFSVDERKPIKALCDLGIEFRDSYILSGYSLSKVASNLTSHTLEKMVGDLDYSLIRHSGTELTQKELKYCENDVLIILYYINEQIRIYGDITKLPLTNTGRVRKLIRDNCLHTSKTHKKDSRGRITRYRKLMQELKLTPPTYFILKDAFMGGFTHASSKYSGELLEDVYSIDFTSSYPAVMLSEMFPMGRPIEVNPVEFDEVIEDDEYLSVFTVRFKNLRSALTYETYLSESKCSKIKNPVVNNGRVFMCDECETTITNVDYDIMKCVYSWEDMEVIQMYKFYKTYLPKPIIESILSLYEDKTTLKGVEGKEVEYLHSKGMLNSIYGMSVTDIVRNEITYDNGDWVKMGITPQQIEETINKHNDNKNRCLYYAWGVWVTAYARKNLWNGILNIGDDYVYSDTDSIKFLNYEKHKKYIETYNQRIMQKLEKMCQFHKIDISRCKPKTIKGVEKPIGVWDYEGHYSRFKTLGSKRYMYEENGKIHITVAGLSKKNGVEYLEKVCEDNTEIFNMFNDELYIPAEETGKNTHSYIDTEYNGDVIDYKGSRGFVDSKSSIHLEPCEFTLSISKQYATFLQNMKAGFILSGYDFKG